MPSGFAVEEAGSGIEMFWSPDQLTNCPGGLKEFYRFGGCIRSGFLLSCLCSIGWNCKKIHGPLGEGKQY